MRRVYRMLLRLYPYDFRAAFEREMLESIDRAGVVELTGLLRGIAADGSPSWQPTDRCGRGRYPICE